MIEVLSSNLHAYRRVICGHFAWECMHMHARKHAYIWSVVRGLQLLQLMGWLPVWGVCKKRYGNPQLKHSECLEADQHSGFYYPPA